MELTRDKAEELLYLKNTLDEFCFNCYNCNECPFKEMIRTCELLNLRYKIQEVFATCTVEEEEENGKN